MGVLDRKAFVHAVWLSLYQTLRWTGLSIVGHFDLEQDLFISALFSCLGSCGAATHLVLN